MSSFLSLLTTKGLQFEVHAEKLRRFSAADGSILNDSTIHVTVSIFRQVGISAFLGNSPVVVDVGKNNNSYTVL